MNNGWSENLSENTPRPFVPSEVEGYERLINSERKK